MTPEDSRTNWQSHMQLSESELQAAAGRAGQAPAPAPTPDPPADEAKTVGLVGATVRDYRIERKLGQGGMGAVYLGVHEQLARQVAIKVLPPSLSHDEGLISRFRREAQALAQLDNPHIVAVHDMFENDGRFYIVMGYAAGGSVKQRVAKAPLPELEARRLLLETARGLAAAHSRGIVHRDIKPDNLLLSAEGRIKIADFGLAKGEESSQLTVAGTVMGTPAYMSPEQWDDSSAVDIRSDLYAVGCTFFTMLTGRPPFQGPGLRSYMKSHCAEVPPDVQALRPGLGENTVAIVRRLLAKAPEDRFQTPAALIAALEEPEAETVVDSRVRAPQPASGAESGAVAVTEVEAKAESESESELELESESEPESEPEGTGRGHVSESESESESEPEPDPTLHGAPTPLAEPAPAPASRAPLALGIVVGLALLIGIGWWATRADSPDPTPEQPPAQGEVPTPGEDPTTPPPPPPPSEEPLWWEPSAAQEDEAGRLQEPLVRVHGGLSFVLVPAGSFTMGSPAEEKGRIDDETPHEVRLGSALYVAACEVSRAQYEQLLGVRLQGAVGPDEPAVHVAWLDALRFCNALSVAENLTPVYTLDTAEVTWNSDADGFRLPTEAEWEYLCRAGTGTAFWTGDSLARDAAVFGRSTFGSGFDDVLALEPVGSLRPNPWGLYDTHGNAYEWCWDRYGLLAAAAAEDPRGPRTGPVERVIRGGAWYHDPSYCRSARRAKLDPGRKSPNVGFRPVRSIPR